MFSSADSTVKCHQCDKKVYEMEKITADSHAYHKTCFRCAHCNRVLSLGNYATGAGRIYCKPHFISLFRVKGNYDEGFQQDAKIVKSHEIKAANASEKDGPVDNSADNGSADLAGERARSIAMATAKSVFERPSSSNASPPMAKKSSKWEKPKGNPPPPINREGEETSSDPELPPASYTKNMLAKFQSWQTEADDNDVTDKQRKIVETGVTSSHQDISNQSQPETSSQSQQDTDDVGFEECAAEEVGVGNEVKTDDDLDEGCGESEGSGDTAEVDREELDESGSNNANAYEHDRAETTQQQQEEIEETEENSEKDLMLEEDDDEEEVNCAAVVAAGFDENKEKCEAADTAVVDEKEEAKCEAAVAADVDKNEEEKCEAADDAPAEIKDEDADGKLDRNDEDGKIEESNRIETTESVQYEDGLV